MLHVILNEWLFPFIAFFVVVFFLEYLPKWYTDSAIWFLHGWCHVKLLLCSVAVHLCSLSVFAVDIYWHQCSTALMIKGVLVSSFHAQ